MWLIDEFLDPSVYVARVRLQVSEDTFKDLLRSNDHLWDLDFLQLVLLDGSRQVVDAVHKCILHDLRHGACSLDASGDFCVEALR